MALQCKFCTFDSQKCANNDQKIAKNVKIYLYVDIKVSGGLYTGMTCQEVDQLINENDWKHHKSTTESNWYYSIEYDNEDSPYVVSYSLDTKKKENQRIVTDITVNLYDNYDYD